MKLPVLVVAVVLVAQGTIVVIRLNGPNYAPPLSAFSGGELTFVHPPAAEAQKIETVAIDSILTTAPAGTQSHAFYTYYTGTSAIGYLTYDAAPKLLTSFVAHKDILGNWKITYQKHGVIGTPDAAQ